MRIILLLLLSFPVFASERDIQELWCEDEKEYVLPDRTRVDCLTEEYAIEIDFASKWAQGIGQSLYYAKMTGRKPGILIILLKPKDCRYVERIKKINIKVWTTPFECYE